MAFIRVEPVEVHVRTDWFSGRPAGGHAGATSDSPSPSSPPIREEAAAYPVITGPRTLFEVETPRRSPRPDLPASIAALDGDRPRRGHSGRRPRSRPCTRIGARRRQPARARRPTASSCVSAACPPSAADCRREGRARRYRPRPSRHGVSFGPHRVAGATSRRSGRPTIAAMHDHLPPTRPLPRPDARRVHRRDSPRRSPSRVAAAPRRSRRRSGPASSRWSRRLSTGRPKFAAHEDLLAWAIATGERLRDAVPGPRRRGCGGVRRRSRPR